MAAENYHLKWDSHLSYLNSSVATLYKNEKFADVMLYSSSSISSSGNGGGPDSGIPTVGISAHKFILSSCSQFFATMFETSPVASPNGVLYVVLPPELSHRAIQILVQYMYSGEATVSNDILSEVLRGGELLKIRGLCRTSSSSASASAPTSSSSSGHHAHHLQTSASSGPGYVVSNGSRSIAPPPPPANAATSGELYASAGGKCASSRYSLEHQQQQFRGLGASVMPKDSPVIVKSPKMPPLPLLPPSSAGKHQAGVGVGVGVSGISINKEVAIDPEDKCCYVASQPAQEPVVTSVGSSICTGVGCSSCSMSSVVETEQLRRRQRSQSDEHMAPQHMGMNERLEREHTHAHAHAHYSEARAMSDHCERLEDEEPAEEHVLDYERRMCRNSPNERDRAGGYYLPEPYEHSPASSKHFADPVGRLGAPSPPLPHSFLTIKQEPSDWTTAAPLDSGGGGGGGGGAVSRHAASPPPPAMLSPKQPLDFKMPLGAVKIESTSAHSADEEESPAPAPPSEYDTFTRLVCEVCKKSFDEPKSWVRHLESHAPAGIESHHQPDGAPSSCAPGTVGGDAMPKSYVPKKRRRVSQQENSMDHVTLLCDICSTSFETPAEWVRHMNNQHTEIELALYNSKKDIEHQHQHQHHQQQPKTQTNNSSATSSTGSQHKKASSRTSSLGFMEFADKVCDICNKKFSSHSNMLLHKRSHVSGTTNDPVALAASPGRQQSNGISNRELNSASSPA